MLHNLIPLVKVTGGHWNYFLLYSHVINITIISTTFLIESSNVEYKNIGYQSVICSAWDSTYGQRSRSWISTILNPYKLITPLVFKITRRKFPQNVFIDVLMVFASHLFDCIINPCGFMRENVNISCFRFIFFQEQNIKWYTLYLSSLPSFICFFCWRKMKSCLKVFFWIKSSYYHYQYFSLLW